MNPDLFTVILSIMLLDALLRQLGSKESEGIAHRIGYSANNGGNSNEGEVLRGFGHTDDDSQKANHVIRHAESDAFKIITGFCCWLSSQYITKSSTNASIMLDREFLL